MARTTTSPEFETDPHMDGRAARPRRSLGEALHALMHAERRVAGAQGVILLGERRTEERHDSVAHHLVDRALVPVDGFHHQLEDGVQELARFLGIAIRQQLQRPLQIGEQHGHLLSLALERRWATRGSCPPGTAACRRPGDAEAGTPARPRPRAPDTTARPQSPQNFAVGGNGVPQPAQRRAAASRTSGRTSPELDCPSRSRSSASQIQSVP